jgi:hypothetical protein
VAAVNCDCLWVVDGSDLVVEETVLLPGFPQDACVNEQLGRAYVCAGETLVAIEADNAIGETLSLGRAASGCSVDEVLSTIYVGCPGDGVALVILDETEVGLSPESGSDRLALHGPLPNPFTTEAQIRFSLPPGSGASLRIYDPCGALVRTLFSERDVGGWGSVVWDGATRAGTPSAPGIYIASLEAGGKAVRRKICRMP